MTRIAGPIVRRAGRVRVRCATRARVRCAGRAHVRAAARHAAALVISAALLAHAAAAHAHGRSLSYSTWQIDRRGAHVEARLTSLDLASVPDLLTSNEAQGDAVADYLAAHLRLLSDGQPCPPAAPPRPQGASSGWVVYSWDVVCAPGEHRSVASDLLLAEYPTHLHFVRAELPGGRTAERVLSETEPRWELPTVMPRAAASGAASTGWRDDVKTGIRAILSSGGELAFLTALLLLARTTAEVAMLVTAFTVAQSAALVLAAVGLLQPEPRALGALVGFSIALVAAENGWLLAQRSRALALGAVVVLAALAALRPSAVAPLALLGLCLFSVCHAALLGLARESTRPRAAAAFAFGIVHGLAIATPFAELDVSRAQLATALVGFNAGVALGQLTLVLLAWPLLRALGRLAAGRAEPIVAEAGSAALCGLGLYWFTVRAFG